MIKYITMCLMAGISLIILLATRPQGTATERTIDISVIERDIVGENLQEFMDVQAEKQAEKQLEAMRFELKKEKYEVQDKNRVLSSSSRGGIVRDIPNGDTSKKTYMDFKKITSKSSDQYKIQQLDNVYTDDEGFRRIDDKFIVAVGSFYGKVGQELRIELSTGRVFNAIIGDQKADRHTDSNNQRHKSDGSVLEFLVSTDSLDTLSKKMGDISHAERADLKGDIANIELIEGSNILD